MKISFVVSLPSYRRFLKGEEVGISPIGKEPGMTIIADPSEIEMVGEDSVPFPRARLIKPTET